MGNGWIKLHRKLVDNPIFRNEKYLKLWIYILLRANHRKDTIMWNGGVLDITEGQFVTGRKQIALDTGLKESTIEDILKYLEKQHQIRQHKTNKFRLITILKWDEYQNSDSKSDIQPTSKQQQADTNKNDKKVKNDKKEDMSAGADVSFERVWSLYPKKELKKKSRELWERKNLSPLVEEICTFIEAAKKTDRWKKGYVKQFPAFLNGECWNDDLSSYNDKSTSSNSVRASEGKYSKYGN